MSSIMGEGPDRNLGAHTLICEHGTVPSPAPGLLVIPDAQVLQCCFEFTG